MAITNGSARDARRPDPVAAAGARFDVERQRDRLGPVTVGHLVVVEIVALGMVGAIAADRGHPGPWTGVAGAVALLLLVVAFLRRDGGWWYDDWLRRRRWRRRVRAAAGAADGSLGRLGMLAPGLRIRTVIDRGRHIGVGQDGNGWFAVLAVQPDADDLWAEPAAGVRLDRLAPLLTDAAVPVSALSVVSHIIPAPTSVHHGLSYPADAYRQVLRSDVVPAGQAIWVTVRLDARDAARAAASRGGGLGGVDRAMAAAVGRVGKTLIASDLTGRILDPAELAAALATSCGPVVAGPGPERQPAGEDWTAWRADGVGHVTLRLDQWPDGSTEQVFAALAGVPATSVSTAVTLRPPGADGRVRIGCLIRVVAGEAALDEAVARTVATAGGLRLHRLDGVQAPAVYATAPTAAGVR